MKKWLLLLLLTLLPASYGLAEPALLEKVSRNFAISQAGLQTYQTVVVTDKIKEMLDKMTASLPKDVPRPPEPKVIKYWSRAAGKSFIRAEGSNSFPYMQEMVKRFSSEFAVDLQSFLLPADKAGERDRLLQHSRIKRSEIKIGESSTINLAINFDEPVDLNGAFYGTSMKIPQQQVRQLTIDLDPERETVTRIEVLTAKSDVRVVEVRYYDTPGGHLPNEIIVSSPDGKFVESYKIRLDLISGFWIPVRMWYSRTEGEKTDKLYVKFLDYEINTELPAAVRDHLQRP